MKKLLLGAALLVGMICSANAQEKPLTFGVRAGLNINSLSSDNAAGELYKDLSSRAGYHVGVVMDWKVAGDFYIQPGVYFTNRGAKSEFSEEGFNSELKINMSYLQIPVLAQYRFDVGAVKIDVATGPYFAFGLGGKAKFEYSGYGIVEKYDYKVFEKSTSEADGGDFKRFDFGWRIGAGVHFLKNFYVGLNYDLGLTNLCKVHEYGWGDGVKIKNRSFSISLGYNF